MTKVTKELNQLRLGATLGLCVWKAGTQYSLGSDGAILMPKP